MSIESTKFLFSDVERFYHQSDEISPHRRPPVKGGLKAVTVECKGCRETWRATEHGKGKFHKSWGGITFICSRCEAEERVSPTLFDQKP